MSRLDKLARQPLVHQLTPRPPPQTFRIERPIVWRLRLAINRCLVMPCRRPRRMVDTAERAGRRAGIKEAIDAMPHGMADNREFYE